MNTNFSLTRKVRTLSFGNRRRRHRGHLLSSSSSLEGMAQLHPPHVEAAEVTEVLTRVIEPKRFEHTSRYFYSSHDQDGSLVHVVNPVLQVLASYPHGRAVVSTVSGFTQGVHLWQLLVSKQGMIVHTYIIKCVTLALLVPCW